MTHRLWWELVAGLWPLAHQYWDAAFLVLTPLGLSPLPLIHLNCLPKLLLPQELVQQVEMVVTSQEDWLSWQQNPVQQ